MELIPYVLGSSKCTSIVSEVNGCTIRTKISRKENTGITCIYDDNASTANSFYDENHRTWIGSVERHIELCNMVRQGYIYPM